MKESRLAILDKYKGISLQNIPVSNEYWEKDAALQKELEEENNELNSLIKMSDFKYHQRFSI